MNLALNKLLQKQAKKLLTAGQLEDPSIRNFLMAVNDSYLSYERDKELLNHAFGMSEKEYRKLYEDLENAYGLKKLSIDKLKEAIREIDQNNEIDFNPESDDLLVIVDYLNQQIIKRKETENNLSRTLNLLTTLLSKLNSAILVEDENRRILFTNQMFCDTFGIPVSPENMVGIDCSKSAEETQHLFKNNEAFMPRISEILKNKAPVFADVLELKDGRILERDYIPIYINQVYKGHLWDYTDITQRKMYENKLVDLTSMQNAILNGTDYSIIYTDPSGLIKSFNRGAEKMLGYSAEEIENKVSPAIFHEAAEVVTKARELTKELGVEVSPGFDVFITKSKSNITETNEWTYIKKDGGRLAVMLSVSSIRNAANDIIGYLGIARDITEQKKAQKALELSEQRYRSIVEKSTDVIYKTNTGGYFTYINPVAERVTGYKRAELLNKHFTDLIKEDHRAAAAQFYSEQLKERKQTTYYEFPVVSKTGEEVWIGQSVQLSELDGNTVEFTALAMDITERKSYERSLFLQNEKYRNIITNMNIGLLEVDLEDRVQFVNNGFTAISGYSKDELLGKKAAALFVLENEIGLLEEKARRRARGISDMYEISIKNKKGELRWWMVSGAPNYNDKGELIGSIGIHLDITEKKELELALEAAKLKAEESSRAKASFLANMSHEIRTPLNGIIGMIRELSYEDLPDKQMKYVSNASVASQHLLSVLNNILDISKIEAGELSLEKHHFRLKDTIKDVKSIMTLRAREKGLLLGLDAHEIKGITYIGDSSRIRQILLNLIGNAIKFTDKGGVYIECKIKALNEKSHTVSITVEDTGIGMEESYLNDLFKKFSQEDLSTSRKYGGTGLGMAITNEIIQLMGGTIHVSSKKNEGTFIEMIFDLPVGDDNKVNSDDSALIISDLSHVNILLVEDNEFNRAVACNTLQRFKCKVTEAVNGKEAIEVLKKTSFDIILMDLQMPLMDGFETTRKIREELHLTMPIVALTANAFKSELEQCIRVGMNDYVTKPFEEDKLMGIIIKLLKLSPVPLKKQPKKIKQITEPILYNLEQIVSLARNDTSYIRKMIEIFSEQAVISITQLQDAFTAKDPETIYQVAHRIKPSLDTMGISSLHAVIRELEKTAKEGADLRLLAPMIESVVSTLTTVVTQLKEEKI